MFVLYCYECLLVVSACGSLHVCIWRCEHERFGVEVITRHRYINVHSFTHQYNFLFLRPVPDEHPRVGEKNIYFRPHFQISSSSFFYIKRKKEEKTGNFIYLIYIS